MILAVNLTASINKDGSSDKSIDRKINYVDVCYFSCKNVSGFQSQMSEGLLLFFIIYTILTFC